MISMTSGPPHLSTAVLTTASFSTGFFLFVEYTAQLLGFSICKARFRMRHCTACRPRVLAGFQSLHRPTFFLMVPSPEQGTSARIRSNLRYRPTLGSSEGSRRDGY